MVTIAKAHKLTKLTLMRIAARYASHKLETNEKTKQAIYKALKLGKGYPIALTVYHTPQNTIMLETITPTELFDSAMPIIKLQTPTRFLLIGEDF